MNCEILFQGDYPIVKCSLAANEELIGESGCMLAMSTNIDIKSSSGGTGIGGMFKRAITGESLLLTTFTAKNTPGEVYVAPASNGDLRVIDLVPGKTIIAQKGSFLASEKTVKMEMAMQSLSKGLFSGEGFFQQKFSGSGKLIIGSHGNIMEFDLAAGQEIIIDNGHLVAWDSTITYEIQRAAKGIISTFASGEGLVCRMKGPGKVLVQTRTPPPLVVPSK